jgi:hypothetical protein
MDERQGLSRELQIGLGEKLRELYSSLVQSVPLHFIMLARRIRNAGGETRAPAGPSFEAAGEIGGHGYDPETVAILSEAFDKAWEDLEALSANPATHAALALRLIALLDEGERNPARLATKAVLELVAPGVPRGQA